MKWTINNFVLLLLGVWTLLHAHINGDKGHRISLRLPARFESIREILSLFSSAAQARRVSENALFQCTLALDEAFANIIEHSYEYDPDGEIDVDISLNGQTIVIALTDFGHPYDPLSAAPPQVGLPIEEMRPGGLGLHLMRSVMDEVNYVSHNNGNQLVMVKRFEPGSMSS